MSKPWGIVFATRKRVPSRFPRVLKAVLRKVVIQTMNLPKEEWVDIRGYEGLYMVSSYGRIYSVPRRHTNGGIIKPSYSGSGYLQTHLCKNGVTKTFQVHRIVAEHFLDNQLQLPEVNHKDENKSNNCVWNLEFCTRDYNQNYGTAIQRAALSHDYSKSSIKSAMHRDYKEVARKQARALIQYSEDGTIVKRWDSLREAARELGYSCGWLSSACNGVSKKAYGYFWKFEEDLPQ